MRSGAVILPPGFDLSLCVSRLVSQFALGIRRESSVEAFCVGILHGLARLNKLQLHSAFFALGRQRPTTKLWTVIKDDCLGPSAIAHNPIQHAAYS